MNHRVGRLTVKDSDFFPRCGGYFPALEQKKRTKKMSHMEGAVYTPVGSQHLCGQDFMGGDDSELGLRQ